MLPPPHTHTVCLLPKGNKTCPRAGGGQRTSKLPFRFLLRVPKPGKANYPNVVAASLLLSEVTLEDNLIYCRSYLKCLLLLFCLVNGGRATEMKVDRGMGLTDLWGRKRAKVTAEAKMFKECLRV